MPTSAVETFLRSNLGSTVSLYNMTALLSDACVKTASISNITNGFKKTWVKRVESTVFSEPRFVDTKLLLEEESVNSDIPNPNNSIQGTIEWENTSVEKAGPETNDNFKENNNRCINNCSSEMLVDVTIDEIYPLSEHKDLGWKSSCRNRFTMYYIQNIRPEINEVKLS